MFLHLLRPNPASILTFRKLTELLKPDFSVEGSNRRHFEDAVYTRFIKYLRRAAGENLKLLYVLSSHGISKEGGGGGS